MRDSGRQAFVISMKMHKKRWTGRMTLTKSNRQRGIYPSIVASVSLCFATILIDRLQVKCKPVGNGSIARLQPTLM